MIQCFMYVVFLLGIAMFYIVYSIGMIFYGLAKACRGMARKLEDCLIIKRKEP